MRKSLRDDVVRFTEQDFSLSHRQLEEGVLERSLKTQPDHASTGVSETLVRDVTTSVVREIVGILESLTDRLLLEKKHTVIRHMVGELMTEDIAESIATGRQQLRELEFGQINRDLEMLHKRAEGFDDKLAKHEDGITGLRASQEDLRTQVDEKLLLLQQDSEKSHATIQDLQAGLRTARKNHEALAEEAKELEGSLSDTKCRLLEYKNFGKEQCATREELSKTESRLLESIAGCNERTDQGLLEFQEFRKVASDKSHVQELRDEHHERLRELDSHASASLDDIAQLQANLKELKAFCAKTYMEKVDSGNAAESMQSRMQQLEALINKSVSDLEAEKASRRELEHVRTTFKTVNTNLQKDLEMTKFNVEQGQRDAECFQTKCDAKYATRLYADEVSSHAADDALKVSRSHASDEVSRLGERLGINTRVL